MRYAKYRMTFLALRIVFTSQIYSLNTLYTFITNHTTASINVRPFSSTGGSRPDCFDLLKQKLRR